MKTLLFIPLLISFAALPAGAEVFKCIDRDGAATYQDTNCRAGSVRAPIDGRYSSTLPLALPPREARFLSQMEAAQRAAHEARLKRIDAALQRLRRKRLLCRSLTSAYLSRRNRPRPHAAGSIPDDTSLVQRMRAACSD